MLVSLVILPEIILVKIFKKVFNQLIKYQNSPYYNILCSIGCVANLIMMGLVNLVGFVVGDKIMDWITLMLSYEGDFFFNVRIMVWFEFIVYIVRCCAIYV
jgi:hypothetical protein